MSYIFDVGDETVWSPSLSVGRLYVETTEAMGLSIGVSTGLIAEASDMYELHPQQFPAFVYELGFGSTSKHEVYRSLVRGFVAVSLVMMERGGIGPDVVGAAGQYGAEMALLRNTMPR
ncbi:DUF6086 family protein [Glycomyces tritici]|uniref:DUF6086 family protein n=1 Tax=Glycomyces tritici TaxID=2665176 RepID=A0ABT7YRT2_9ACTN|nr:DUF6086 family protein [Glycomyces tritici]MDN3241313.1 DUF6086 family protein [Glycomyces tritici]MDN3243336.1 DUF6086 family protein [Glycomyces tritici]